MIFKGFRLISVVFGGNSMSGIVLDEETAAFRCSSRWSTLKRKAKHFSLVKLFLLASLVSNSIWWNSLGLAISFNENSPEKQFGQILHWMSTREPLVDSFRVFRRGVSSMPRQCIISKLPQQKQSNYPAASVGSVAEPPCESCESPHLMTAPKLKPVFPSS